MTSSEDHRQLLRQMVGTCKIAAMIVRTHIKHTFEAQDAQMATIIVNNIDNQVARAEAALNHPTKNKEELEPHIEWARGVTQEMEWIWVPNDARAVKTEGGAYVEALIHVEDSMVEEVVD